MINSSSVSKMLTGLPTSYFWGGQKVLVRQDLHDATFFQLLFSRMAEGPPGNAHGGSIGSVHCALGILQNPEAAEVKSLFISYKGLTKLETQCTYLATAKEENDQTVEIESEIRSKDALCSTGRVSIGKSPSLAKFRTVGDSEVGLLFCSPLFQSTVGNFFRKGSDDFVENRLLPQRIIDAMLASDEGVITSLETVTNITISGTSLSDPRFKHYEFHEGNKLNMWTAREPLPENPAKSKAVHTVLAINTQRCQADLPKYGAFLAPSAMYTAQDEIMGQMVFMNAEGRCLTANLMLDFEGLLELNHPTLAMVYMKTWIDKVEGRKVFVRNTLHAISPEGLASNAISDWEKMPKISDARGLFIDIPRDKFYANSPNANL